MTELQPTGGLIDQLLEIKASWATTLFRAHQLITEGIDLWNRAKREEIQMFPPDRKGPISGLFAGLKISNGGLLLTTLEYAIEYGEIPREQFQMISWILEPLRTNLIRIKEEDGDSEQKEADCIERLLSAMKHTDEDSADAASA